MTLLELWVHTPLAQSLGFALAHSLWEGAAIAVLLAVTLLIVRSAPARYGAACVAMLLMLASFGVTVARLMPQPIELAKAPQVALHAAAPAALPQFPEAPPQSQTLAAFLPWAAPFWAAGVLFFHLRSLAGWIAARRLRRSGVCAAPAEWQSYLDGIARRLHVSKPVALLESCLAEVPVVIGYARPVILMPVGLLAGLPAAQVEAILIHELAHIRRQDYLVNLMQTFVEGLLFYHPAVWWISSVIRAERENCCDDLAVAATGDPRQYAAALTALEQNRSAAQQLALAATGGSLVNRIRRVLHQPERPRAVWTPAISATLLFVGAGLALANWQAATEPKPQAAPAPAVSTAPATAPTIVLPVVQLPAASSTIAPPTITLPVVQFRKPAPMQVAQMQAAQVAQAQQPLSPVAQQLKDQLEREVAGRKTVSNPYTKWLNEDVAYIITNEERAKFKAFTTDDEREKFIEQFWQIRNPLPNSSENPFKAEHYRRIGYANEHFSTTTSLPGWKTDRGRIYITFGPPDEIDDHSSGGTYNRPPEEGGGTTQTFPFQQWRYKYIQGVGNNVVVEFIDPTYTKEFRMTTDPSDKDALKFAKLQQPNATASNEFQRLEAFQKSGRGGSAASTPQSPAAPVGNMFVSSGDGPKLTLTVTSAKRDNVIVTWPIPAGTNGFDIIGRVTDANGRTAAGVRDVTLKGQTEYTMSFTRPAGNYTLDLVARDRTTEAIQTSTVSFYVN